MYAYMKYFDHPQGCPFHFPSATSFHLLKALSVNLVYDPYNSLLFHRFFFKTYCL